MNSHSPPLPGGHSGDTIWDYQIGKQRVRRTPDCKLAAVPRIPVAYRGAEDEES